MISLIVARAANNVIGNKGQIPWYLSNDLKYFRKITTDGVVIMGRKTYDSIGKPLPNRVNIVVSTSMDARDDIVVVPSFEMAIREYKTNFAEKEAFLIGGHSIYDAGICLVDKMYITEIGQSFEGDTKFADFDASKWDKEIIEDHSTEDIPYQFVTYTRR